MIPSELEKTLQKSQDRTATGQTTGQTPPTAPPAKVVRGLAKDHADYWKAKLKKRQYTDRNGKTVEVPEWQVRIFHAGREGWFNCGTANRSAAAVVARNIYVHLTRTDWESTLAKFKGGGASSSKLTVGAYIQAVEATGLLRAKTLRDYAVRLRAVVAYVFGVKGDRSKYNYRTGGRDQWLERIHAIKLEKLTPARVERWMRARLAAAGNSPLEQARQKRNINTMIRCAKSLFSRSILKKLGHLQLPTPLPFDGIEFYEAGSMRYVSKINPALLIALARAELKDADPEAYKVFLLGLFAGLRKGEVDSLEWRMIDFETSVIRLEETEFLHLKTPGSADEVPLDSEVAEELRAMMGASTSAFVLTSNIEPKNGVTYSFYRADRTFKRLNVWLHSKGVDAQKPLHLLRKELGAIVASESGIFAASRLLRHSNIGITSRFYTDQKRRVVSGLGKFLKTELKVTASHVA